MIIDPELCSLLYSSIDQATTILSQLDQNSLLAKIDIASAYRNVLVHPSNHLLLGMQWDNPHCAPFQIIFCFTRYPRMDLSKQWSHPHSTVCKRNLDTIMHQLLTRLRVHLVFLEIILDSNKMEVRLLEQKLSNTVLLWLNKSKRVLLSLIGDLVYASKVMSEGRPFLCRMIT